MSGPPREQSDAASAAGPGAGPAPLLPTHSRAAPSVPSSPSAAEQVARSDTRSDARPDTRPDAPPASRADALPHTSFDGAFDAASDAAFDTASDALAATLELAPASGAASASPPAAWFGKIPSVGDYVGRRLPTSFQSRWDSWLQAALAAGSDRFGPDWTDLYMTFPVWRFLAPRGLLADQTWTGILLPSVDRVGRRYPLTVAMPVPALTAAGGLAALERRLARLGGLVDPVLDGASIDQLEAMLERMAAEQPVATAPASGAADTAASAALAALTDRLLEAAIGQQLLWWQAPTIDGAIATRLLPLEPASFVALVAEG